MIFPVPEPYEVVSGRASCDHIGSHIVSYDSPEGTHMVWSCPRCRRIVRQDIPVGLFGKGGEWTTPVVKIPQGLEGVLTSAGRVWGMPNVKALPKTKRWGRV